jgi:hypothetical protein
LEVAAFHSNGSLAVIVLYATGMAKRGPQRAMLVLRIGNASNQGFRLQDHCYNRGAVSACQ